MHDIGVPAHITGYHFLRAAIILAVHPKTEPIKSKTKQGGAGKVDKSPIGTEFTVAELMEYAIRYSDNTAYYMLNERFGFDGFMQYAESIGVELSLKLTFPRPRFGYLSARRMSQLCSGR